MASKNAPEAVQRDAKGRLLPGTRLNPKGRPKGPCTALKMCRDWAEAKGLPLLMQAAEAGDLDAAKALLHFGLPRQKPITLPEPLPLAADGTLSEQARAVVRSCAEGRISPDTACEMMQLLTATAKIDELVELREQVERLKQILERRSLNEYWS